MTEPDRRTQVLEAALPVFARHGYRKTSMDDVAKAADISRPGLYFAFSSKHELFRAAVQHSLDDSLAAAGQALSDQGRPLRERLIEAFDEWAGRYVGPMAQEIGGLMDANPGLLGTMPVEYPKRFLAMLVDALSRAGERPARTRIAPVDVARTLVSTAAGIKYEVTTREQFRARMTTAIDLYGADRDRHGA
ncbi:TetR family transcriptional regulator [Actinocatenispora thailandica]|uniref:TetR family transcriptional regulator n=1 Tax=Actinocatenispora thailandica TaxID=227318 RepID=A0A7R7DSG3_9ACTN|nr:TetR/AcrR family transcriptional regulator [Actinocatenispora thailandica]BCJ37015.1 TetR family transcriptional regulator [Actinocatenispora thailandica]